MTFKQAHKALKALAAGKYYSLDYRFTETSHGSLEEECRVYIDGQEYHNHCTWEGALESMRRAVTGETVKGEQAPEKDVKELAQDS